MATYKSICDLTHKEETIWIDLIPVPTLENPNNVIIGLMSDCSVHKRDKIEICKECNIYQEL